jgi:hypothetical protein
MDGIHFHAHFRYPVDGNWSELDKTFHATLDEIFGPDSPNSAQNHLLFVFCFEDVFSGFKRQFLKHIGRMRRKEDLNFPFPTSLCQIPDKSSLRAWME